METIDTIKYTYKGKTSRISIKHTKRGTLVYTESRCTPQLPDVLNVFVGENKYQYRWEGWGQRLIVQYTTEYLLRTSLPNERVRVPISVYEMDDLQVLAETLDRFLRPNTGAV